MKKEFHIGMRTIKTALSVLICLLIYHFFSLIDAKIGSDTALTKMFSKLLLGGSPTFACIAAVICLQDTVEGSVKFGVSRIIGSVVGGLFGMALHAVNQQLFGGKAEIPLATLGVVVLIWFCTVINHKEASSITAITFLIIIAGFDYSEPYVLAINRIIGTAIGVAVSISVNIGVKAPSE